jgi:asparagine synthase (glutamine-hydrolysing)
VCGISAVVSKTGKVEESEILRFTQSVRHRGPDGYGVWFDSDDETQRQVALGHTRLSILDLSDKSNQPIVSSDRRYALSFNGEIYNYIELRNELQQLGHDFETTGDSEVLLKTLIEWDAAGLRRIRGMFAFVFVDTVKQRMIVARDEFGIKPLYRCEIDKSVYFASEIKQFVTIKGFRGKLNHEVAIDFLLFGITDHRRDTHFDGVQQVLPGECVVIDYRSQIDESRFLWRSSEDGIFSGSYDEACQIYRELLLDSIGVHLRADVEIGSCLSGGLDSSAIVGIVSHEFAAKHKGQSTFTATSENSLIDERVYAQSVVEFSGASGHFVQPDINNLWKDLEAIAWHQDEPYGSTSIFAQWTVFAEARRHGIKVMLDGQGADEQLGGYNSFINTYLASCIRSGHIGKFTTNFRDFRLAGRTDMRTFAMYFAYSSFNEEVVKIIGKRFGIGSQNHLEWVNQSLLDNFETRDPYRIDRRVPKTVRELSTDMIYRSNLPMLLRFEDRNSMAHGIEARVPFVDGPLMHFTLSLPAEYLLGGPITKPLLRDSVGSFMPMNVRSRRDKIGFQTAEQDWFRNDPETVLSYVDEAIERLPSLFSSSTRKKVERVLSGKESFNNIPWRVLSMNFWAKAHGIEA